LAKWIAGLSDRVASDDQHQVVMLSAAAVLLTTADAEGNIPELNKEEERFILTVKQGCEARGAKRTEAAVACLAVYFTLVKAAAGYKVLE